MTTCATCTHWDTADEAEAWGTCGAILGPQVRRVLTIETRAYLCDGSGYFACLTTRSDFGCTLHEPRDPEETL